MWSAYGEHIRHLPSYSFCLCSFVHGSAHVLCMQGFSRGVGRLVSAGGAGGRCCFMPWHAGVFCDTDGALCGRCWSRGALTCNTSRSSSGITPHASLNTKISLVVPPAGLSQITYTTLCSSSLDVQVFTIVYASTFYEVRWHTDTRMICAACVQCVEAGGAAWQDSKA